MKPTHSLLVRDWKQDVINLVQFPRTTTVPDPSPFALKLETWIRMNKLNYHNVSNEFTKGSATGQIPFIELNGRQIGDSANIIDHLTNTYNLSIDKHLNTRERAEATAITALIEESLYRCLMYDRSRNFSWLATDKGFSPYFTGIKKFLFEKILIKKLQGDIKSKAAAQGIGRRTEEDVNEIAKRDLSALSTFLGDKKYLFGDRPTTVDATLFGPLVQLLDTPLNSDKIKPFIEQRTINLVAFVKRIKEEYWPDWDAILEHRALNPEDVKPQQTEAAPTNS